MITYASFYFLLKDLLMKEGLFFDFFWLHHTWVQTAFPCDWLVKKHQLLDGLRLLLLPIILNMIVLDFLLLLTTLLAVAVVVDI